MTQLLLHLWGDYVLQSQWMADNKVKRWWPAIVHATVYALPFLLIGSPEAVFVIWSTHAVIDRFRLARFVCWAKNFIAPPRMVKFSDDPDFFFEWDQHGNRPWNECKATGYPPAVPDFLAYWLLIITDNTLHLTINWFALRYL